MTLDTRFFTAGAAVWVECPHCKLRQTYRNQTHCVGCDAVPPTPDFYVRDTYKDLARLTESIDVLTARCEILKRDRDEAIKKEQISAINLQELIDFRTHELEKLTKEAYQYGDQMGYKEETDAYAALFTVALTEPQATAAILMILTRNGIPAHNGDGVSIIAQALVKRSQSNAVPGKLPDQSWDF